MNCRTPKHSDVPAVVEVRFPEHSRPWHLCSACHQQFTRLMADRLQGPHAAFVAQIKYIPIPLDDVAGNCLDW
jgi:hypothetical protein